MVRTNFKDFLTWKLASCSKLVGYCRANIEELHNKRYLLNLKSLGFFFFFNPLTEKLVFFAQNFSQVCKTKSNGSGGVRWQSRSHNAT